MAWRDSRSHRRRLLLFVSSIVLGIAALVAIGSFGVALEQAIDEQAKTLMGADLMFSSLRPFPDQMEAIIDSLAGEQARALVFSSMAYFPKTQDARLVQVRALDGPYPFYGAIETEPQGAALSYLNGPFALVDAALLLQYGAQPGDSMQIGTTKFVIAARIKKLPSSPPVASSFNPKVYVPVSHLDTAYLLDRGSLVSHRVYFKFDDNRDVEQTVTVLQSTLNRHRIRTDTVENRKQQVGDTLKNLYRFLNLVGFVALVLGGIGVASAVHVYTRHKLGNVAILRCVGARAREAVLIYLLQVVVMSVAGSLAGAGLGIVLQAALPAVFSDFLPVTVRSFVSWGAVVQGFGIGLSMSLLFALLPLLSLRKVSPLLALRASFGGAQGTRDRVRYLLYFLIILFVTLFAITQSADWQFGAAFALALLTALLVLAGVAKLLTFSCKRFFPKSWSYVWRQGLANLYRPNNQTLVLMLAVGLGTFLITTLYLTQNILIRKVSFSGGGQRPNLVFFDIQTDQKEKIGELVQANNLPVVQEAPIVTMRLAAINSVGVEEILSDSTAGANRGLLRWEFRTTYRDYLFDSEEIVAGEWIGRLENEPGVIPISLEEGTAARMNIELGDTLVWNVQGVAVTTRVASLRKVDWQRVQANFMVVFPVGALDYAPQVFILATWVPSAEASASLQREVLAAFPNVSMIDLALVLNTLDSFLSKVSFVIRFMAFFSIFTGMVVLAAAVITSRFQRIQESVLLRTLGASRKQISTIMVVEYIFLGGLSALTGLVLAYIAGWALAYFVFESVFLPSILPFVVAFTSVVGLTVLIGLLNSRGVLDRPPLEVLRLEN